MFVLNYVYTICELESTGHETMRRAGGRVRRSPAASRGPWVRGRAAPSWSRGSGGGRAWPAVSHRPAGGSRRRARAGRPAARQAPPAASDCWRSARRVYKVSQPALWHGRRAAFAARITTHPNNEFTARQDCIGRNIAYELPSDMLFYEVVIIANWPSAERVKEGNLQHSALLHPVSLRCPSTPTTHPAPFHHSAATFTVTSSGRSNPVTPLWYSAILMKFMGPSALTLFLAGGGGLEKPHTQGFLVSPPNA